MKKLLIILFSILVLASCIHEKEEASYTLTDENLLQDYRVTDRSLQLSDKGFMWFLNLWTYLKDTEVNEVYLSNNKIETLDVSWFTKLLRLDINNNNIRFMWDLKLPENIRSINLSGNKLDTLAWIEKYKNIKILDVSNNQLQDDDIDILEELPELMYLNIEWNQMSEETINRINEFNSIYLRNNEVPFTKE